MKINNWTNFCQDRIKWKQLRRLKLSNSEVVAPDKEEEEFLGVISMRDMRVFGPICCSFSPAPFKNELKRNSWSIANRSSFRYITTFCSNQDQTNINNKILKEQHGRSQ